MIEYCKEFEKYCEILGKLDKNQMILLNSFYYVSVSMFYVFKSYHPVLLFQTIRSPLDYVVDYHRDLHEDLLIHDFIGYLISSSFSFSLVVEQAVENLLVLAICQDFL